MRRNTVLWIVLAAVIVALGIGVFLMVRFWDPPLKEGTVVAKTHEDFEIGFVEIDKRVYRTESYYNTSTKSMSTRRVFDHYEYAVQKITDHEDFMIQIEQPSKKREGFVRQRVIYVDSRDYESADVGGWFEYNKDWDHTFLDRNNEFERVTPWTRHRADLSQWR